MAGCGSFCLLCKDLPGMSSFRRVLVDVGFGSLIYIMRCGVLVLYSVGRARRKQDSIVSMRVTLSLFYSVSSSSSVGQARYARYISRDNLESIFLSPAQASR